jgi:hypothetical protein
MGAASGPTEATAAAASVRRLDCSAAADSIQAAVRQPAHIMVRVRWDTPRLRQSRDTSGDTLATFRGGFGSGGQIVQQIQRLTGTATLWRVSE